MSEKVTLEEVWAYLPSHYPRKADRDDLLASADSKRRVQVWDFFFPLDKAHVVRSSEEKRDDRIARRARLREKLVAEEAHFRDARMSRENTLIQLKATWEENLALLRQKLQQEARASARSERTLGLMGLGVAGFFMFVAVVLAAASGWEKVIGCGVVFAVIPCLGGLAFLRRSERDATSHMRAAEQKAYAAWQAQCQNLEAEIKDLEAAWQKSKSDLALEDAGLEEEIRSLQARILALWNLVPTGPGIEEVDGWFKEELEKIRQELLRDSGQEGRLVKTRSGIKDFCIRGPAELQHPEQIEPLYSTQDDLRKHLSARRAERNGAGKILDLYGVWIIEFLFLGMDELISYRVFYDFIAGRKSAQFRVHSYNAVALIETRSHFKEISVVRDGKEKREVVDDVPSVSFALENGERIEIAFPNEAYIREAFPGLDSAKRLYDPNEEAKEAIKVLRENVHKARTYGRMTESVAPPLPPEGGLAGGP